MSTTDLTPTGTVNLSGEGNSLRTNGSTSVVVASTSFGVLGAVVKKVIGCRTWV